MLLITSMMNNGKKADILNQQEAVRTWKDMGFRVLSANIKEEIYTLKKDFQDIEFVELKRSGKERYGKPIPFIFDMFRILEQYAKESELCGIINSDIYLRNLESEDLEDALKGSTEKILCAHRYDILEKDDMDGEYYFSGIDAFFMRKETLRIFEDSACALSKPEWDHWVVYHALLNHIKVFEIKNAVAFHVKHEQRWTPFESNSIGRSGKKDVYGEEYYDLTNQALADIEGRILLKRDVPEELLVTEQERPYFYFEEDALRLAGMEMNRHQADAVKCPLGVGYFRGKDFKRICALHGDLAEKEICIYKHGAEKGKTANIGEIAVYVDFMQTKEAKSLRRFYVYSAGRAGKLMIDCLLWNHIMPLGFIDKDSNLCGTTYKGVPVFGLEALGNTKDYDKILIVSNLYVEEIYQELSRLVEKENLLVV